MRVETTEARFRDKLHGVRLMLVSRGLVIIMFLAQETLTNTASGSSGISIRRDEFGRQLIFPYPSVPYTSFYSLSGRPCGYLNVESKEQLPTEGARIVLNAGLGLAYYSVLQSSSLRATSAFPGSAGGSRNYAYICSVDGKSHAVVLQGEWTYDLIVQPPKFVSVKEGAGGCTDRGDWSSLDGLKCQDYVGAESTDTKACFDMGSIDTTIGGQRSFIQRDIPAYVACPHACGNCWTCTPPSNANASNVTNTTTMWGCTLGSTCQLLGAVQMVDGVVVPHGTIFPSMTDPVLLTELSRMRYSCSPGGTQQTGGGQEIVLPPDGGVFEGYLEVQIESPTQGATEISYTLDGSTPSLTKGRRVPAGIAVALTKSGVLSAIAIMPEISSGVTRTSTVARLPHVSIVLPPPLMYTSLVGHFATPGQPCMQESSFAESRTSAILRTLTSNGCPPGLRGVNAMAKVQVWVVGLPTEPLLSRSTTSIVGDGGIVGFATDGVPIVSPPPASDEGEFEMEQQLRDECGGLALTVRSDATLEQHGMYHYRTASTCVGVAGVNGGQGFSEDGHSKLVGFMLDGIPLYGPMDGLNDLDECGGHKDDGRPFYHYHAAGNVHPYTVPCLRGCLRPEGLRGINMALLTRSVCVPSAVQYDYSQLTWADWVTASRRSGRALTLAGGYTASFRVDMVCARTPHGLPDVEYVVSEGDALGRAAGAASVYFANASVLHPVHVRAVCKLEEMLTSAEVSSDDLTVTEAAQSNVWPTTLAFWDLTDAPSFFGTTQVALTAVQGGCTERFATHISPSAVPDLSSHWGSLTYVPPRCKAAITEWDAVQQPSLVYPGRDGNGVPFSARLTPGGLALVRSVGELGEAGLLPLQALTLELFATFDLPLSARSRGGFFSARYDAPAFFGRGVSLTWEGTQGGDVVLVWSVSTELSESPDRGGVATTRSQPLPAGARGSYVHIAGVYNTSHVIVYVNGSLSSAAPACTSPPCGMITWPSVDKNAALTLGYADSTSHHGGIAMARVLRDALTDSQISASAQRNVARGVIGKGVPKCAPGSEGPYDGEEPCRLCEAGKAAAERGQVQCTVCEAGKYALPPGGALFCIPCEGGVMTPREGAVGPEECTGPDYCGRDGDQRVCHVNARCIPIPGGGGSFGWYTCECLEGFEMSQDDACIPVCGDGIVVGDEQCDDGGVLSDDGCSSSCTIEQGFTCTRHQGGPHTCTCTLDVKGCCQRAYSWCLAGVNATVGSSGECIETCFQRYSVCLSGADMPWREALNDTSAAAAYLEAIVSVDINGTIVSAYSSGCDLVGARLCHRRFEACKEEDEAMELLGMSPLVEDSGECSESSCMGTYSSCMALLGCVSTIPEDTDVVI